MIGCLFHVFEPSYSWEHIHTFFWLAETPDIAKKDWTVLHCTPTENKANILNKTVHFVSRTHVASTFDTLQLQPEMDASSKPCGSVSNPTMEKTILSKCILQSNMAMENHPFGCFPRSPSFAENFLAGHDYRSVATGHQAPPFSRATIFTAVSHPWRVRSMPKRGYSNAKKTTVPTWGNQDGSWVYSQFGK